MNFLKEFSSYDECAPPGVLLPDISIEKRHYLDLKVPPSISNYDFLRELCKKGVEKYGISELDNKKEYYSRTKMELKVFRDLGFVDYVLLNWDVLNYCHEKSVFLFFEHDAFVELGSLENTSRGIRLNNKLKLSEL